MKYCSQCGAENPETARFCRQCGQPFKAAAPADPTPEQTTVLPDATLPLEPVHTADAAAEQPTQAMPPTPDPNINVMATQPIERPADLLEHRSDDSAASSSSDASDKSDKPTDAAPVPTPGESGDAAKAPAEQPAAAADATPAFASAGVPAGQPTPTQPAAQPQPAYTQPAPQPQYAAQPQPVYGQQPGYAQPNYAAPAGQPGQPGQPAYAQTGQYATQPPVNGQYGQQPYAQPQPAYGQPGYQQPAPGTPGAPGVPAQQSKFEAEARTFGVWLKTFFSKPTDVGVGKPWYAIVVILAVALFSALSCLMVSSHGGSAVLSMIPVSSISSSIGSEASSAAPGMFMTLWIMFALYDYGSLAIAWLMLRIEGDPTPFGAFHDRVAHALGPWAVLNIAAVLFALVRFDFLAVLLWMLATGTRAVWMTSLVWNGEVRRNLDPQWVRFLCVLLQSVLLGILLIILSSITGAILGSIVASHASNYMSQFGL